MMNPYDLVEKMFPNGKVQQLVLNISPVDVLCRRYERANSLIYEWAHGDIVYASTDIARNHFNRLIDSRRAIMKQLADELTGINHRYGDELVRMADLWIAGKKNGDSIYGGPTRYITGD